MSSKFSDQVAQGMSEILKNESFYKPFKKVAQAVSGENVFNITQLQLQYPDAYNALTDADKKKLLVYTFSINPMGRIIAKEPGGTNEYMFFHSPDRPAMWMKTAESAEYAFELYAAKKKKEDEDDKDEKDDKKSKKDKKEKDEKDEKSDKKDKKSKKDDKDDEEEDEKDEKKSKKKSKKDEDENDAMALVFAGKKDKEEKKDGKDKSEKADAKEDKPKGKKETISILVKKEKSRRELQRWLWLWGVYGG